MVIRNRLFETIAVEQVRSFCRVGPPPRTKPGFPHAQLDQWPPRAIAEELLARSLQLPHVRSRQSRMASPDTRALCLPDSFAGGPTEAFIDGHEFCFLHPRPEFGIHLTLPKNLREDARELGWVEPHPLTRLPGMPEALVMVYSPRDYEELEVVFGLIKCSWQFASGSLRSSWGS